MSGLPLLKLGSLLLKQLAKPLAARLKIEANKSPTLTRRLQSTGQYMHFISSRITVFASGYKFIGVKPLPDEEALKSGIDVWSEAFLVISGACIIIYEYDRNERKNAVKAKLAAVKEAEDKKLLNDRFEHIEKQLDDIMSSLRQHEKDQKEKEEKSGNDKTGWFPSFTR